MFNDSGKCLETSNGLMLVDGSEMGRSTLGERRFDMIVDIIPMTLSLWSAEVSLTWALSWALDRYVWI